MEISDRTVAACRFFVDRERVGIHARRMPSGVMRSWAGLLAMSVAASAAMATPALATTVSQCLAGKLGDVGRATAQEITCHGKDATKPDATTRTACVARAEARLTGGTDPARSVFAKRERRPPCPTVGDQDAVADDVAAYVASLSAAVGTAVRPSRCDAAKLQCLGRYVTGLAGCLARAAKSSGTIDPTCVANQASRLGDDASGCLGKAALRADCSTTGNAAVLALGGATFAASMLCTLDPGGNTTCDALPTPLPTPTRTATPVPTRTPTPMATGGSDGASQLCVDRINEYRASIGRAPLARWTDQEGCVESQGFADMQSGTPHSAFGQCTEWAQNECPGWPGPPISMIGNCLAAMWAEGPGEPYSAHGHYINMANPNYTKVACGFAVRSDGRVWAVQDFR
jgi:hypothetical protein